ncbi:MAG: alpha/beta fold hydrolase [Bacteroidetes bacterium]|nr:alpha/beta fold hydrolase [Bacteroidota bacterium]
MAAKKRNWRKALRIILGILATLYIGICAFMYFAQESILFHPTVQTANAAWDLSIKSGEAGIEKVVEELNFPSEEGGMVNALLFKMDSAKGAILYLHGNGGNAGICAGGRNRFLGNGWDFFVPDYRGYGKSTGELSQSGMDADVEAAWNELSKRYPANRIIIYGQSMGSGFATRLAAKHRPKLLILEAPYTSLADVASSQYPWLPVKWLLNYPSESEDFVGSVQSEVVIFHGDEDEVIPYSQGLAMSKAANKSKLITLPGQGHLKVQNHPKFEVSLDSLLR